MIAVITFPNPDWSYEGPDTSVGIFGHAFVHETCPVQDEEYEVTEEQYGTRFVGRGRLRDVIVTTKLTCTACQATALVEDRDYSPEDEEDLEFAGHTDRSRAEDWAELFGSEGWPAGMPIDYDRDHQ